MVQFQNPFFRSKSKAVEEDYVTGVKALQRGDFDAASVSFKAAAEKGHVSALYNLALIWGGGRVTPYDFDLAADCWYKAAEAGHPKAKEMLWQLEAADRGGFGAENLAKFVAEEETGDDLIPSLMICAARFYDVICRKYGAVVDVIAYELDAAAMSEHSYVHSFLKRTGIGVEFYRGGLDRIKSGSAADQITDGLNKFSVAMRASGASEKTTIMARCSIVGYIIQKSPYGESSHPLLGRDRFFTETAVDRVSKADPSETEEDIFRPKNPSYDEIFSSRDRIFSFLYGDPSRTATVLGDETFIDAWHASSNSSLITDIIKTEAEKGNLPSIKQMIWLCNVYFQNARDFSADQATILKIQIQSLEDRAKFCGMAVKLGDKAISYQAMTSYQNLYSIYVNSGRSHDNLKVKAAVLGIVAFAEQFIASGYDDEELIQDARNAIKEHRVMAMFIASEL